MFLAVGAAHLFTIAPFLASVGFNEISTIAFPTRSHDELADKILTVIYLSALAKHRHTVWIFVFDGEVIEYVPVPFAATRLPTAQASNRFYRVCAEHPIHDIQVVNVLFNVMIPG